MLVGALLVLMSLAPAVPNLAGATLQERSMQAVPSYVNPITGEIEDPGQSPELGQGMSENLVMQSPATKLIDAEGSIFITFRIGLVAESQDLAVELLDEAGQVERSLPFSIVEDFPDDNMRDIRIMVPTENPTLRISLLSIPMGREVICFTTFAPEGEAVAIPIAEDLGEVDDSAITIVEADPQEEALGIAEEDRGQVLTFLAIAGGLLLVIVAVAVIVAMRKKKQT